MKNVLLLTILSLQSSDLLKAQLTTTEVPVRISSLDASSKNQINTLYWKTACFIDYANFEIQRSYNGSTYTTISTFSASSFRCQQPFDFSDSSANQLAGHVFYRLKVGDLDGRVYNSKIVAVISNGKGVVINSLVPSVINNTATLSISSSENIAANISVINTSGTALFIKSLNLTMGLNSINLNLEAVSPGRYWLILRNPKFETKTVQFLKL
jgi:hypothetical protein